MPCSNFFFSIQFSFLFQKYTRVGKKTNNTIYFKIQLTNYVRIDWRNARIYYHWKSSLISRVEFRINYILELTFKQDFLTAILTPTNSYTDIQTHKFKNTHKHHLIYDKEISSPQNNLTRIRVTAIHQEEKKTVFFPLPRLYPKQQEHKNMKSRLFSLHEIQTHGHTKLFFT